MRVLVTGASGFLGRGVVRAAARDHQVVAMRRRDSAPASLPEGVEALEGDLRQPGRWTDALGNIDAVIHLAAAASGDLSEQFGGTVTATENLLAALAPHPSVRIVHVSSFSVYEYSSLDVGADLDECAAIERDPLDRDPYTATKILQERLVREACRAEGRRLAVIRPGAIYGPGKEWDSGIAVRVGRLGLIVAPRARMRLTHVDNCSEAIVAALAMADLTAPTVNVVDDDLPTHWGYFRACRAHGLVDAVAVPVPWLALRAVGMALDMVSRRAFGPRPKLPELLSSARQEARWKPLRYPNARAHTLLGWQPRVDLDTALDEMSEGPR